MTFSRQLVVALLVALVCALGARAVLSVHEMRGYLARQLESHARDAARSLGLSISLHLAAGDELFAASIVDSLFDSGDYQRIELRGIDGNTTLLRERAVRPDEVPAWFVRHIPIVAPVASADLTAGWRRAGTVRVRSHPGHAYRQLWRSTVHSAQSALAFLVVSMLLLGLLVGRLLRPLKQIEAQAVAVAERRFPRIDRVPRTREFRRVAEAMNFMTGNVEKFITEQAGHARQLEREAYLDPVTGLRNRRALRMDIEQLARQAPLHGTGALMLINVAGLDRANRSAGYQGGDHFVRAVAAALDECLREHQANLGRYGGAVFCAVLPAATAHSASELSRKIIATLSAVDAGATVEGVNVGMVTHAGADDADMLIGKCESALSNAERSGPGASHLWSAGETAMVAELHAEAHWRRQLTRVIEQRAVVLEGQPVRSLDGSRLLHLEVLARVADERGDLVPAGRFIPLAARLGMSTALDTVIFDRVLELLASADDEGDTRRFALNLSAAAAADSGFVDQLAHRLAALPGATAARLSLEVDEHFASTRREALQQLIEVAHPLGVCVGVDQCGAGDVSLAPLRGLALDYAKLYGAYTRGIDDDRERRDMARSLLGIGHGMGLMVVAEFVETEAELDTVRELGFDAAQGFVVGRPARLG